MVQVSGRVEILSWESGRVKDFIDEVEMPNEDGQSIKLRDEIISENIFSLNMKGTMRYEIKEILDTEAELNQVRHEHNDKEENEGETETVT